MWLSAWILENLWNIEFNKFHSQFYKVTMWLKTIMMWSDHIFDQPMNTPGSIFVYESIPKKIKHQWSRLKFQLQNLTPMQLVNQSSII